MAAAIILPVLVILVPLEAAFDEAHFTGWAWDSKLGILILDEITNSLIQILCFILFLALLFLQSWVIYLLFYLKALYPRIASGK